MYSEVYDKMVDARIACKHPLPVWRKKDGEITEIEEEAFGCKSEYELIHPSFLVFVDEVGSNTSQAKDKQVGGQTYLCGADGRPQQRSATVDAHFTVLGFTAASGDPLMCAIIFAAERMDHSWTLGLDPFAVWEGHELDFKNNHGEGKRYPMGPECNVNGKRVPCFCCHSETGGITGDLLVKMLKTMDDIGVFDRDTGLNPFLILDGHGSRFDLGFLEYINSPLHKWTVCLGVPYGTSIWQVGDSTEQNGCFHMALTKEKQELVTKKNEWGLDYSILKTDVVLLVSRAWAVSFARKRTNIKAVSERGWGPKALNMNCLTFKEILASKPTDGGHLPQQPDLCAGTSSIVPSELNLSEGCAGTLTDKLVAHKNQQDRRNGANHAQVTAKRNATAKAAIAAHKRLTAGLLVSSGQYNLGPDVLLYVREKKEREQLKLVEKEQKAKDDYDMLLAEVETIKQLQKLPEQWTAGQLKTMVKWYKRDKDAALPTKKQDLLTRYNDTCGRGDRPVPLLPTMMPVGRPPLPPLPLAAAAAAIATEDGESIIFDDNDDDSVATSVLLQWDGF